LNDIQEMMLESDQCPFGMFPDGDMADITGTYKTSSVGTFNEAELHDLYTLNDKNKHWLGFLTEEGIEIPPNKKFVLNFGRCYVGQHNKITKHFRNNLKVTELKITNVLHDTNEKIITKTPIGSVKAGQTFEIEFDWKPLSGSRKPMRCSSMIQAEAVWSKRMDKAIYPFDY